MTHIFISYSHNDKAYVSKLYDALRAQGFDPWIDDRIDYGTQWPHEIERRIRECAAFVLVMSPDAKQSEWVQNELNLARDLKKPVFPVLLKGDLWWTLSTVQYVDVRGGKMPPQDFYTRLAAAAPGGSRPAVPSAAPEPVKRAGEPRVTAPGWNRILLALLGAIALNLAGYVFSLLLQDLTGLFIGFDAIGTFMIALLAGPLAGALAVVLSLVVVTFYYSYAPYYIVAHLLAMLAAWWSGRSSRTRTPGRALLAGLAVGFVLTAGTLVTTYLNIFSGSGTGFLDYIQFNPLSSVPGWMGALLSYLAAWGLARRLGKWFGGTGGS